MEMLKIIRRLIVMHQGHSHPSIIHVSYTLCNLACKENVCYAFMS